jgi:neutral ceramidase
VTRATRATLYARRVRFGSGGALAAVLACACGEDAGEAKPGPPPWDDDAGRLGHCAFAPAPARVPRPASTPTTLRAGYAEAPLVMPIGAPLGGYGGRVPALGFSMPVDARARRWATGMTPSAGVHDAQRVQALALEAGGERWVLVRMDAPFVTENVLFELERLAAPDGALRGRIVLAASHSHAGWAGWLPTFHLTPGADQPRADLFARVLEALRAATVDALARLAPARIGLGVEPSFDPDDRVGTDRRSENDAVKGPDGNEAGAEKDPVLWAMRVDDAASGTPLVAAVSLAIHGTVGTEANPLASSDAPGAIARALAAELGHPVMHLQGAAGDTAPADVGGRTRCTAPTHCLDLPGLEILGARAAALAAPLVRDIATEGEAAFEIATRSFAVGRGGVVTRPSGQALYYLPPDPARVADRTLLADGRAVSPFDEFGAVAGAGLCGEADATLTPMPGVEGLRPYGSCLDIAEGAPLVLGVFGISPPPTLPLCDSVRATGAAVRVATPKGGEWLVVAAPGEPTAPWAAYLRARSPAGAARTLLIGYADDYSGYLLTAEDWLAGGYECSTNIWGPREGEQILEALLGVAAVAWTPEIEDPEVGSSRLETFPLPDVDAVAALATTDHGVAAPLSTPLYWPDAVVPDASSPATIGRAVGLARFAWYGGDPAVDAPEVTVEREASPGRFEATASSRDGVVLVGYRPEPLASARPTQHRYTAVWQPVPAEPFALSEPARAFALPLGRYRFRVKGGALAGSGRTEYTLVSPALDVVPAPLAPSSEAKRGTTELAIVARVGPAPGLRALREGASDGELPLHGPWTVTVTLDDASAVSASATPDPQGAATVTLTADQAKRAVSVELRDPAGNGGVLPVPP